MKNKMKYFEQPEFIFIATAIVKLLSTKRFLGVVVEDSDPVFHWGGDLAGTWERSFSLHFTEYLTDKDLKIAKERGGLLETVIEQFERELEKAEKEKKE